VLTDDAQGPAVMLRDTPWICRSRGPRQLTRLPGRLRRRCRIAVGARTAARAAAHGTAAGRATCHARNSTDDGIWSTMEQRGLKTPTLKDPRHTRYCFRQTLIVRTIWTLPAAPPWACVERFAKPRSLSTAARRQPRRLHSETIRMRGAGPVGRRGDTARAPTRRCAPHLST
jgi:hypothetical protein